MSLKDTFRKAAEIFVEMPEEEEGAKPHSDHSDHSEHPAGPGHVSSPGDASVAAPASDGAEDIDKRLAEMSKRMAGLQAEAASALSSPQNTEATPERDIPKTLEMSAEDVARLTTPKDAPVSSAPTSPTSDAPLTSADGKLDVGALYARANVPSVSFTAEQALEMIHSLPANLPDEFKRQTVQVTIASMGKAIGATPETIMGDATRKREALASYASEVAEHATAFTQAAEFEIGEMERQIAEKRDAIRAAQDRQAQLKALCDAESAHLAELLTFLGGGNGPVQ